MTTSSSLCSRSRHRRRRCDECEGPANLSTCRTALLLLRPAAPVEPDAVVARLPTLDTIGAGRLLLAALDLARLARPASRAAASLRFRAALLLWARHGCSALLRFSGTSQLAIVPYLVFWPGIFGLVTGQACRCDSPGRQHSGPWRRRRGECGGGGGGWILSAYARRKPFTDISIRPQDVLTRHCLSCSHRTQAVRLQGPKRECGSAVRISRTDKMADGGVESDHDLCRSVPAELHQSL